MLYNPLDFVTSTPFLLYDSLCFGRFDHIIIEVVIVMQSDDERRRGGLQEILKKIEARRKIDTERGIDEKEMQLKKPENTKKNDEFHTC